jgi:hypothetical protein
MYRILRGVCTGITEENASFELIRPAIELVSEWRSTGVCEARVQGARRSTRIESHAAEILALVKAHTLHDAGRDRRASVQSPWRALRTERGLAVLRSPQHHLQKKKHLTLASRIGRTWPPRKRGRHLSLRSTFTGWCSSTRREPRPRWRGSMAVRRPLSPSPLPLLPPKSA